MWILTGVSEYLQALIYMQSVDISKLINISEPDLKFYSAFRYCQGKINQSSKDNALLLTC